MKIGLIGAGGIGIFHIREYLNLGCEITAILGKDAESIKRISKSLYNLYKIRPKYFSKKEDFFKENFDVVDISSPAEFHSTYIKEALNNKKEIFCEKPFIFDNLYENLPIAEKLIELAKINKKRIFVNTHWRCIFDYFNLKDFKRFEAYMEPGVKGVDMMKEHLAHMNSILIKEIPKGKSRNIVFIKKEEEQIIVDFEYGNLDKIIKVRYELKNSDSHPREVRFIFDGNPLTRKVDEKYKQSLIYLKEELDIEDPFKISIKNFLEEIKKPFNEESLNFEREILENIRLQDEIIKSYFVD
jgi:hypothetical protein